MKKYLALAILPVLASCSSTRQTQDVAAAPVYSGKGGAEYVAEVPAEEESSGSWWRWGKRPTKKPSRDGVKYTNRGLKYPMNAVDQGATSTLDVTEDSADYVTGVGTRQVRDGSNITWRTAHRGTHVVRKEGGRIMETVYDIDDQGAGFVREETLDNTDFVMNGYERTMYSGGTVVCGALNAYSNVWDSGTRGLFGGLLRCGVRNTKPYMVGSLNDQIRDDTMPGAGWKRPMPNMTDYAAQPATASGKGVYTSSK